MPSDHPIRKLRVLVDGIPGGLDGVLAARYAEGGGHLFRLSGSGRSATVDHRSRIRRLMAACELNCDDLVHLDAEDLAGHGIADAYNNLIPELVNHIRQPALIDEILDCELPSCVVRRAGVDHLIYSSQEVGAEQESSGRATYYDI